MKQKDKDAMQQLSCMEQKDKDAMQQLSCIGQKDNDTMLKSKPRTAVPQLASRISDVITKCVRRGGFLKMKGKP
ncbi:hypothetical protein BaRGS_00028798, partial [Batillaria attramentaria]